MSPIRVTPSAFDEIFGQVYVINLARRTDRWEQVLAELERARITRYQRFEAYDSPADGNYGCTRSHRELLRRVASEGAPREPVLVLEDDFHVLSARDLVEKGFTVDSKVMRTFLDGPRDLQERLRAFWSELPRSWDVVYLGAGYAEAPRRRHSPHVLQVNGMLTTSSYAITRSFARRWSDWTDAGLQAEADARGVPVIDMHPGPIDNVFCNYSRRAEYYCFQPRLMIQRAGKSDLNGEVGDYLFSMTDPNHEDLV